MFRKHPAKFRQDVVGQHAVFAVDGGGTEYACFEGFDCLLVTGDGTLTVLNAAALDCGGRGSPHPLAGA